MTRIRPLLRALPRVVALVALVGGLFSTSPAPAETRSVVLVLQIAELTPGPVDTEHSHLAGVPGLSTDSWLTSSVQDPHRTFTAVGPHWTGDPGT